MSDVKPIIEMTNIEKHFGSVIALAGVSVNVFPGECHCLLGDNGAGKSTFIKTMSGVHQPTKGEITFEGAPMHFNDPRDAISAGIATVHQHLAMIPLMSVSRNFFMGNEPIKKILGLPFFDHDKANEITMEAMRKMGINLRGPDQAVGTLSGGGNIVISVGRECLIGANAGLGIPLGDRCTIEAGLFITAGTKVTLLDGARKPVETVSARDLAGKSDLLFRRNSTSGTVECLTNRSAIELNDSLHANN